MEPTLKNTALWEYLSEGVRGLLHDGEKLALYIKKDNNRDEISDYSFLVFSFSKAYEGFLKQLFLDIGLIDYDEYYGDEIRIGRILNPNYQKESQNIFKRLCDNHNNGESTAQKLWQVWQKGRNSVFHYFPHNYKSLNYEEALDLINEIITAMQMALSVCDIKK